MRLSAIALVALAFCGCVSVDEDARAAINALSSHEEAKAIAWGDALADKSHYSRTLGAVESGRVHMLAGNYQMSEARFRAAVDSAVARNESAPKIKVTDVANTVLASTVTDDRTRDYYLPPYELNLALEYGIIVQALNGRRDDALADARLSVYVQDTLASTYGADVAKAESSADAQARAVLAKQNAALESMIAETRNSWENPVLWWLTGILFEADGQPDMAWQSYRKAAAIKPDCAVFAADAARADGATTPAAGKAKLVVIFDQGFIPRRQSLKIPIPIYTGFAIDIPQYDSGHATIYDSVSVGTSGKSAAASRALDVRSLAARDLKEQLPGIVIRNLTRAAVQAGAQAAVNSAGNEYAQLAVFAGNMLVSSMRRADIRSWTTLPVAQHVWSDAAMDPGVYEIEFTVNGAKSTARVPLAAGETRLLWVSKARGVMRGASAPLGQRGAPTTDLNGKEIKT